MEDFTIASATGLVPDGCVPMTGIYFVTWADSDGEITAKWHLEGEPDFHTLFGIMETAKFRLMAQAYGWDGSDD